MAWGVTPGDENGPNFTAHCRLPTAVGAAPAHQNAVAVSGGWGMVEATPEDRPVVAGSGAPDLFGEAENELMCPAS